MKKILLVLNNLNFGGVQSFCMNLFRHLTNSGFTVHFVVEGTNASFYEKEITDKGFKVFHLPCLLKKPFSYLRSYKRIIKEENYDIVHVHMNFLSIYPLFVTPKKILRVCHAHASYNASNLRSKIFRLFFGIFIGTKSDYLLGCSKKSCEWLYKKRKYYIVSNGIDIDKFAFDEYERTKIREELHFNDNDIVLITVGMLSKNKRQDFLIDAFLLAKKEKSSLKMLILGDGEEKNSLLLKINSSNLSKDIFLLGNKNNIYSYLSSSDLFIFGSQTEGFGLAIIEACANGLNCLISETIDFDYKINNVISLDANKPEIFAREMLNKNNYRRNFVDLGRYDFNNTFSLLLNIYLRKI